MPWKGCCGQHCPRKEIEFLAQCFVLLVVIVVSLYNLTAARENEGCRESLWASLLGASVGICTPGPVITWSSPHHRSTANDGGEDERDNAA